MYLALSSTASLGVLEHVPDGKFDVGDRTALERNGKLYLGYDILPLRHGYTSKFNSGYEAPLDYGHNGIPTDKLHHGQCVEEGIQEGNIVEITSVREVHTEYGHYNWPSNSSRNAEHWQALDSLLQQPGVPSMEDFVSILHESRELKNLDYARALHMHACAFGLDCDILLGNYLVPMFVGCGSVSDAHRVFCKLACPNEFSWSALAQGFVECGELQQAIGLCKNQQMVSSSFMLTSLLKACSMLKCVGKGQELHSWLVKQGNDSELFVGNSLVDMYAKCGFLAEAREVFEKLPVHDVISWTTLIAGYAEFGLSGEVFTCLELMRLENVSPNAVTYICSLKVCGGSAGHIDKGQKIHTEIVKESLETDLQVSNSLIDMYIKSASFEEAEHVFYRLAVRDVFSWTALVKGYSEHGVCEEALVSLEKMRLEGVSPNAVTFSYILKACRNLGAINKGFMVHSEIVKEGHERNVHVGTTLLDMHGECGSLEDAQQVFDTLPSRNTVSWNALIAAYADSGFGDKALSCYEQMQSEDSPQDEITFIFSLKASASTKSVDKGQLIHSELAKEGFENDPFVGSMLVDMYAKHGYLVEAWEVFNELPNRDVVSWTALVGGFAELSFHEQALDCFELMVLEEVSANAFTYGFGLKACGGVKGVDKGMEFHSQVVKQGIEKDVFVCNALVDMYTQCGALCEAEGVFSTLSSPDVVSWNILIEGYVDQGLGKDALVYFDMMQQRGVNANAVTYICALRACGSIKDLVRGQEIHLKIVEEQLEGETFVGNCLVDMYAKCGSVAGARHVFGDLLARDVVSWNALIGGYLDCGHFSEGLVCFEQMKVEDGLIPDSVTYVRVLRACSNLKAMDRSYRLHAEIVQEGFEEDSFVGAALVGMYATHGYFSEAKQVLWELPVRDVVSWTALMTGYAECGHGEEALKTLQHMQQDGVLPNAITFLSSLKACSSILVESRAFEVQSEIVKRGFDRDIPLVYTQLDT